MNEFIPPRKSEKLSGFNDEVVYDRIELAFRSPTRIACTRKSVLPFPAKLPPNLLNDVIGRAWLPVMSHIDLTIGIVHQKPLDNDGAPHERFPRIPASAARWIEFTIGNGYSSASFVPRKRARAALTLRP